MELQIGVKAFLQNKNGEYLILRRNAEKYPDVSELWDIPGGRIQPGAHLLENLSREIYEETKLPVLGEPKLISAQDILKSALFHVIRLTYIAETDGEPILDGEHDEYCWLSIPEMREIQGFDIYAQTVLEEILFPVKQN